MLKRKNIAATLALLAALLVLSLPAAADSFQAKVRQVTDGDTIVVSKGGRTIVVQLAGIDAPELGQEYGYAARDHIRQLSRGKRVEVEVVESTSGRSVLARVAVDGQDLAAQLVASGLAWTSKEHSSSELEAAQERARRDGNGLWASNNPTPPWEYRASA